MGPLVASPRRLQQAVRLVEATKLAERSCLFGGAGRIAGEQGIEIRAPGFELTGERRFELFEGRVGDRGFGHGCWRLFATGRAGEDDRQEQENRNPVFDLPLRGVERSCIVTSIHRMQVIRSIGSVRRAAVLTAYGLTALSGTVQAQATSPVVPGYEHLRLAGATSEAALGEILLGELNCLSCHAATPPVAERIPTRTAPAIDRIAERATGRWLIDYLAAPSEAKPGSAMPDILHSLAPDERARAAKRLVGYLALRGAETEPEEAGAQPPSNDESWGGFPVPRFRAVVERGRRLFHSVGCVACHEPGVETGSAMPAVPSVPLPDLNAKTSVTALTKFLLDPRAARPGGRMPPLHLTADEAEAIAVYLLRGQTPQVVERRRGFEFEYFLDPEQDEDIAGFFDRPAPDLDRQRPEAVGRIAELSLDLPTRINRGNHAVRWGGLLRLPAAGSYTFTLASDRRSGSRLEVDGEVVATKTQFTAREAEVELELDAGDHAVEVAYFIRGDTGGPFVEVRVGGGTLVESVPLEDLTTYESVRLLPAGSPPPPRGWYAEDGANLFGRFACGSCHTSTSVDPGQDRSLTVSREKAPDLSALDPARVAAATDIHTAPTSPRYRLADHQKRAIRAALDALADLPGSRSPDQEVVHTMASLNCYACHSRQAGRTEVGGPDTARRKYFQVVGGQDLGDEGRLPPPLDGAGGKLKPGALRSTLTADELHVRRDFMEVRMPSFPEAPAQRLAVALEAVDAVRGDLDESPFAAGAADDGRELLGTGAMSCITCHDIHVNRAPGISTIDLATVYDRLRPGWVRRLLLDPAAIRPGTRMPGFWPEGAEHFPDLGGGTVDGQIEAIWAFLSLGTSMATPEGMDIGSELVLIPEERPLVFRTHMVDVGPRSIAIGYPENVHAAFDANNVRLAKVWRGGFFDAKGTWQGRAGQFYGPYGTDVLNLPPGPAIASLDDIDSPWPTAGRNDRNVGGRFLGYRLDEQGRPTLRYRLGDVLIEEAPIPLIAGGGTDLIRRFRLSAGSAPRPLFLLLAEGEEIASIGERTWRVDDTLDVSVASAADLEPIIRDSQGVHQLLQRIELGPDDTLELDVALSW